MAFVVAHRVTGVERVYRMPRRSLLRTGRLLADRLCTGAHRLRSSGSTCTCRPRMPIAVITASLGGHPSGPVRR